MTKSAPPKTPQQRAARRTKQKKRRERASWAKHSAAVQRTVDVANWNAKFEHEVKLAGPITTRKTEFDRMVDKKYIDLSAVTKHLGSLLIAAGSSGIRASDSKEPPKPVTPYLGVVREPEDFELLTSTLAEEHKRRTVSKEEALALALEMAKMLFKADRPYRCRLGLGGALSTASNGLLNQNYTVSTITSAIEWSTINLLFDEVFVHSMTIRYKPHNKSNTQGTNAGSLGATVNGTTTTYVMSAGLIMACFFSNSAATSTADSMISNPTRKLAHTAEDWSYTWRNNTRFDPRGPTLSIAAADGWLGWTNVNQASDLGGLIDLRAMHDQVFGDGGHTITLGIIEQSWDVSFRARV